MSNEIALDKALADQLSGLLNDVSKSVVELSLLASQVRDQHLDGSRRRYDAEFAKFWEIHEMENRFGSLSNFSRYASAGNAIAKVRANLEQYEERLPSSLAAIYELSQLTMKEMSLCFENTFRRSEITDDQSKWSAPKKPKPLINPSTTATAIRNWRQSWRNPTAKSIDMRKLMVAEVKIDTSFYEFKNGESAAKFSRDDLAGLTDKLKEVVQAFNVDYVRLDLHDQKLLATYEKREAQAIKKAEEILKKKEQQEKEIIEAALRKLLLETLPFLSNSPVPFTKKMARASFLAGITEITIEDGKPAVISEPKRWEIVKALAKAFMTRSSGRKLLALIVQCEIDGKRFNNAKVYREYVEKQVKHRMLDADGVEVDPYIDMRQQKKIIRANLTPLLASAKSVVESRETMLPEYLHELGECGIEQKADEWINRPHLLYRRPSSDQS